MMRITNRNFVSKLERVPIPIELNIPFVESRSWNQSSMVLHTCLTAFKNRLCSTLEGIIGQQVESKMQTELTRMPQDVHERQFRTYAYLCTDSLATRFRNILSSSKL